MSKILFIAFELALNAVAIKALSEWFEVAPEMVVLFFILSRLIVRDYRDE